MATAHRRGRGETRAALLEQTILILRSESQGAVTTQRLTRALGMSQPAFYAHFRNLDALLAEVTATIGQRLIEFLQQAQRRLRHVGAADPAHLADHFEQIFTRAWDDRVFIELMLTHRRGESALARRVQKIERDAVDEIRAHLRHNLRGWNVDCASVEPQVHALGLAIHHQVLGAYELLLARALPVPALARMTASVVLAASAAVFPNLLHPDGRTPP